MEMRTYPDTNDIYILSPDKLEAIVFKPTGTPERHPNCNVDTVNIFDRACSDCSTASEKFTQKSPTVDGTPQICKIKDISAGTVSNKR
jgi:hypothetical protein